MGTFWWTPPMFLPLLMQMCVSTVLHNYYCTVCLASSPQSMTKIPRYTMSNVTSACDKPTVFCPVHGLVPHHWLPSQWVLSWHMFQGIKGKYSVSSPFCFGHHPTHLHSSNSTIWFTTYFTLYIIKCFLIYELKN